MNVVWSLMRYGIFLINHNMVFSCLGKYCWCITSAARQIFLRGSKGPTMEHIIAADQYLLSIWPPHTNTNIEYKLKNTNTSKNNSQRNQRHLPKNQNYIAEHFWYFCQRLFASYLPPWLNAQNHQQGISPYVGLLGIWIIIILWSPPCDHTIHHADSIHGAA